MTKIVTIKPKFHLGRQVSTRHDKRVVSRSDVTSQLEFGLYQSVGKYTV